jgi:hypothetical protein
MTTNNSIESSTPVTEIAANGDIILIVGPDKKRIQVHSFYLKDASEYFKAMFGPHFSEGQDLVGSSPKEIPMLDDSANALEIICNIIHHRNDAVPESLKPDEIFEIAIAADKFDCVVVLKHVSTLWLNPRNIEDIFELGYLMAAAYILDNPRAFSEITRSMIFRYNKSYLPLVDKTVGLIDFVPWKTFCKDQLCTSSRDRGLCLVIDLLEERRTKMRTELQQIILDGTTTAGTNDTQNCSCGWSSQHGFAYMRLLMEEKLLPEHTLCSTISNVVKRFERMNDPTMPHEWVPCNYRWHTNPNYRSTRSRKLDLFKKENGICIDCVQSSTATTEQNCRIRH